MEIYSHVCRHSVMVVASIRYPLQMPQVMKGLSSLSFNVWYISKAEIGRRCETPWAFLNPAVVIDSAGYAKPRTKPNRTLRSMLDFG